MSDIKLDGLSYLLGNGDNVRLHTINAPATQWAVIQPHPPYYGPLFDSEDSAHSYWVESEPGLLLMRLDPDGTQTRLA